MESRAIKAILKGKKTSLLEFGKLDELYFKPSCLLRQAAGMRTNGSWWTHAPHLSPHEASTHEYFIRLKWFSPDLFFFVLCKLSCISQIGREQAARYARRPCRRFCGSLLKVNKRS